MPRAVISLVSLALMFWAILSLIFSSQHPYRSDRRHYLTPGWHRYGTKLGQCHRMYERRSLPCVQGGYAYIRFGNPTCEAAEKAVNSIEGGFGSIAFGSGMAAISTTLLTFLHPGDHIVRNKTVYTVCLYIQQLMLVLLMHLEHG